MNHYISTASKYAADQLSKQCCGFEFFEGIRYEFTPESCAIVYRELLRNILTNHNGYDHKYGMFVAVTPIPTEGVSKIVSIQLGVLFASKHGPDLG